MRSFHVKFAGREQGPFSEAQIAQMFADGRVNQHTPCKSVDGNDWKSIDDYLPMLNYGTQLPPPSRVAAGSPAVITMPPLSAQRVAVVDFDIPFGSVLKIMFKWGAAAFVVFCCFAPLMFLFWLIVMAIFAGLIGGAMSSLPHH